MMFRFAIISTLLLTVTSAEKDVPVASLPSCPRMTEATVPKFHQKCNRIAQNSAERRRQRIAKHAVLGASGAYPLIPTQRTVVCPTEPANLSSTGVIGQDTRWVVENKSSGNVVVAYLKNGLEHSAMNPKITPPQSDPSAVLKPGEFKVIHTFEGHVFHVRELLEDGSAGEVLLQHRPGIVEFTNRYGKELVSEDDSMYGEAADLSSDESSTSLAHNQEEATTVSRKKRSTRNKMERCNIVYQGFRNALGQPLDIYYAGVDQQAIVDGPMQCAEKFKFHLGTHRANNTNDWNSILKYEATMVGHSFVARLASNPDIVVDAFTLQPTQIYDCPRRKQLPVIQDQVIEFNGIQHGNANLLNSTEQHLESTVVSIDASSSMYSNAMSL